MGADLDALDRVDGDLNGHFLLANAAGDTDADGSTEMLIALPRYHEEGMVYVVSLGDLASADLVDGLRDGSADIRHVLIEDGSWLLTGEQDYFTGLSMAALGDMDGDGVPEIFVGANDTYPAGYIVSGGDLLAADAADSRISLGKIAAQSNSWKLIGLWGGGDPQTTAAADVNGDGTAELIISQLGVGFGDSPGTVHVFSHDSLQSFDVRDGSTDGLVRLSRIVGQERLRLSGEAPGDRAGASLATADFDGDGRPDLVVGSTGYDDAINLAGAVYILGSRDFSTADNADGSSDGVIHLGHAGRGANPALVTDPARTVIESIDTLDFDGDGRDDIAVAYHGSIGTRVASLVSAAAFYPGQADAEPMSYRFYAPEAFDRLSEVAIASAGDVDGDGLDDILLEVLRNLSANYPEHPPSAAYVIMAAELPHLDAADGRVDGAILLSYLVRERHSASAN